jgi:hypothetical protein
MRLTVVAAALATAALAGCANISTLNRSSDLPDGGKAIHLDAAQRLVYSKKDGSLCAEASPDALQAFAASASGGLTLPNSGVTASLANALTTSAGSIGLRTQSITLMREQLYRICEANHNGLTPDVIQLLERSQDLTLGVLAIEQLTGAVAARQVVLTGDANAEAAASIGSTEKDLAAAQKREAATKAALESAQADEKTAQDAVDAATKNRDAKKAASTADPSDTARKKTADDAQTALDAANDDLKSKTDAVTGATSDNDQAHEATEAVKKNLNTVITNAKVAAKTGASFSGDTSRPPLASDAVAAVADATTSIVRMVLNKGHMTDACMSMISQYVTMTGAQSKAFEPIYKQCQDVIKTSLRVYETSMQAGRAAGAAKTPPGAAVPTVYAPAWAPAPPAIIE